jgi:hypothetical protein
MNLLVKPRNLTWIISPIATGLTLLILLWYSSLCALIHFLARVNKQVTTMGIECRKQADSTSKQGFHRQKLRNLWGNVAEGQFSRHIRLITINSGLYVIIANVYANMYVFFPAGYPRLVVNSSETSEKRSWKMGHRAGWAGALPGLVPCKVLKLWSIPISWLLLVRKWKTQSPPVRDV